MGWRESSRQHSRAAAYPGHRTRALARLALVASLAGGCGSSPAGPADGAAEGDAGPTGPDAPWLAEGVPPISWPCPEGWRQVSDVGGAATCDAYPEGRAATCGAYEVHLPGEPGCRRLGPACPADGLVADLPADRPVVHVLAGATGGDGTRAAPYGSLTDFSWAGLDTGAIVAAGRGEYETEARLPAGISLWGACVAETVLRSALPGALTGVVEVLGEDSALRGVQIGESARPGLLVLNAGRSLDLDGVWIEGTTEHGLIIGRGATLTARDLVVVNTRRHPSTGANGRGMMVMSGAIVDISGAVFERNQALGMLVSDMNTVLTLTDVLVRDTVGAAGVEIGGRGMHVQLGATAVVSRAVIEHNQEVGVFAAGADAVIELSHALVLDTQSNPSAESGRGFGIQDTATVRVSHAVVAGSREIAIFVSQGSSLTMADAVVRDTQSQESDGIGGRGLNAQQGAQVELARVIFARNRELGLMAGGDGTALLAEDMLVTDTAVSECGQDGRCAAPFGMGVGSYVYAGTRLSRFLIQGAAVCGVQVAFEGGLDLVDGVVSHNTIGACVQVDDYDIARLTDQVAYSDNETNLETSAMPIPDPDLPASAY